MYNCEKINKYSKCEGQSGVTERSNCHISRKSGLLIPRKTSALEEETPLCFWNTFQELNQERSTLATTKGPISHSRNGSGECSGFPTGHITILTHYGVVYMYIYIVSNIIGGMTIRLYIAADSGLQAASR